MLTLQALLAGAAEGGLYRITSRASTATLRARVERAGWRCFALDGAGLTDKVTFLRAAGAALDVPPYFGQNWDAFEECLRDLSWAATPGVTGFVLLFDHAAPFIRQAPDDWAVARAVLRAAVAYWRATPTPLVVLLRGAGDLVPDFPLVRA